MYRLLIVDDEPAIVDGLLQHLQENAEQELDICKAYSAIEAMEIAKKTKIDLLISDIRMPGKSGLQLIDELLFYWPACRVILLTGHSEFDYAYKAIQKNVDSYILKMEGIEVIHQAVNAALGKLDEEYRNRSMLERASLKLSAAEPLVKKEFFEALLTGDLVADAWHAELYEGFNLQLEFGRPLMMVAGKVDAWEEKTTYMQKMQLYYSVQSLFAEHLPMQIKTEMVVHDHNVLVWFVQPDADADKFSGERALADYLKGMLEPIQNSCREELRLSLSFVIGKGAVNWDGIGREFDSIKEAFKQRALFGPAMAVIDLDMSDMWFKRENAPSTGIPSSEFNKQLNQLEKLLDNGDESRVSALTRELVKVCKLEMSVDHMVGMERYYRLLLVYLNSLNRMNGSGHTDYDMRVASLYVTEPASGWDTIEEQLIRLCGSMCRLKEEQVEKSDHQAVERIHRFVKENLGNDLSLARIAEQVHFNPSYLSRFYKQITGRNLSDYINEIKADTAIDMLVHTPLRVNEIALRLGFESPSYFTSFFRKMTGFAPQEYRESAHTKGK
ncbi:response regulator [Paenibacillus pasadenensis]|uniref:response regulator transcription factor n=1 Tax=Paenibacillus pasadenensis TaxID=217090 RepID=UPI0020402212|nr:response regulator [Paenibacillus pasadenensis]MCM3748163.1 response regulator [Paenibacillus pasadenensis]